ncbi:MAG: hypothetical protein IKK36_13390 [Bacteroidales bacterium]|nr:hypothetical protein [Bacteroidales bacterium]
MENFFYDTYILCTIYDFEDLKRFTIIFSRWLIVGSNLPVHRRLQPTIPMITQLMAPAIYIYDILSQNSTTIM